MKHTHTIGLGVIFASMLILTLWRTSEESALAGLTAFLAGVYGTRFVDSMREVLTVRPGRVSPEAEEHLAQRYDTLSKGGKP